MGIRSVGRWPELNPSFAHFLAVCLMKMPEGCATDAEGHGEAGGSGSSGGADEGGLGGGAKDGSLGEGTGSGHTSKGSEDEGAGYDVSEDGEDWDVDANGQEVVDDQEVDEKVEGGGRLEEVDEEEVERWGQIDNEEEAGDSDGEATSGCGCLPHPNTLKGARKTKIQRQHAYAGSPMRSGCPNWTMLDGLLEFVGDVLTGGVIISLMNRMQKSRHDKQYPPGHLCPASFNEVSTALPRPASPCEHNPALPCPTPPDACLHIFLALHCRF